MNDRERVIKGLEFCTQHGSMCGSDCNGHYERYTDDGYVIKLVNEYRSKCPYGKCKTGCVKTLAKDALELLKEQGPHELTKEEWEQWKKDERRDPICMIFYGDTTPFWVLRPESINEPLYLMRKIKLFTKKPLKEQVKWK